MRKVILVLVDGLRYDAACEQMGYLHHLVETGRAARFKVKAELPSLSRPLYEVLLTGTPPSVSGMVSNQFSSLSGQKSLFHLTREQGLRNAAAAYYWVSELYNAFPFDPVRHCEQEDEGMPIQFGRFYFEDTYPDSHLFVDGEVLRRKHHPDFLLIHPMGVDSTGHLYGGETKEYRAKVTEADGILARLMPAWLDDGYHVLVTSDHGMNRFGQHGGPTPEERDVPLFAVSTAFIPGVYEEVIAQPAIAPLACRLLGIRPADAMGRYRIPGLKED